MKREKMERVQGCVLIRSELLRGRKMNEKLEGSEGERVWETKRVHSPRLSHSLTCRIRGSI